MLTAETLSAATARLIGAEACDNARFGIAVSGGPDSMALLALAADAFPGRVEAATVDHGLRDGSADEAALVAGTCAGIDVPHRVLTPKAPITGSVQAEARQARYALLDQWRMDRMLDWIMTAHHADDQLETLVMRLNRASGLAGLSGIRARQGHVLRPLLDVPRAALHAVVEARGMATVDDPSNRDPRFDRARVRAALADCSLVDAAAAAASARHLAQEEEALGWVTAHLIEERMDERADAVAVDVGGLPTALCRRLLVAALAQRGEREPRGQLLERAMDDLVKGIGAMIGNSLITPDGAVWIVRPAPARRGNEAIRHSGAGPTTG